MKWTTEWFLKADVYFLEWRKVTQMMAEVYGNHDPIGENVPEAILKEVYGPMMKRVPDCEVAADADEIEGEGEN